MIEFIRSICIEDRHIDFGIYVNSDVIAESLIKGPFSFKQLGIHTHGFHEHVRKSGLLRDSFPEQTFERCHKIDDERVFLSDPSQSTYLAQAIADFAHSSLIASRTKFSMETVFSDSRKVRLMQRAQEAGYRVYFYYVATEDPLINTFRVKKVRVPNGGHDVDQDRITKRYHRSLDNLFEAAQFADRAYFFDNSTEQHELRLFASFSLEGERKRWDIPQAETIPNWFRKYYFLKVNKHS